MWGFPHRLLMMFELMSFNFFQIEWIGNWPLNLFHLSSSSIKLIQFNFVNVSSTLLIIIFWTSWYLCWIDFVELITQHLNVTWMSTCFFIRWGWQKMGLSWWHKGWVIIINLNRINCHYLTTIRFIGSQENGIGQGGSLTWGDGNNLLN